MTQYTKKDLQAVDLLGILLVGIGLVLLLSFAVHLAIGDHNWTMAGFGFALTCLGFAVNSKLKSLQRNGGRESAVEPEPTTDAES